MVIGEEDFVSPYLNLAGSQTDIQKKNRKINILPASMTTDVVRRQTTPNQSINQSQMIQTT